jgi:hypothetical protein
MNQIPVTAYPAFTEFVVLDGIRYILTFTWNTRGEFWSLSVADANEEPIVSGIKLVVGYDLLEGFRSLSVPKGALIILGLAGNMARIAYDDFTNSRALKLVYFTEAELATIRA